MGYLLVLMQSHSPAQFPHFPFFFHQCNLITGKNTELEKNVKNISGTVTLTLSFNQNLLRTKENLETM